MEELAGPADRPSLEESTSLAASALRIALWLNSSELFATAASTIEEHVLSRVAPFSSRGGATLWNNTDVAHGASGTGLYFLWMATRRPELREETRRAAGDAAVRAGTWLLSRAEPTARGLRWARGPRCSTAGP